MSLLVGNRMSKPPLSIRTGADYRTAFDLMRKRHLHHVPVVDAKRVVVGMLAERDLLLATTRYQNAPVEAQAVMRSPVLTVLRKTPLIEAARMMVARKIGGLPVVDSKGRLIGIITETDVLRELVGVLEHPPSRSRRNPARGAARRNSG